MDELDIEAVAGRPVSEVMIRKPKSGAAAGAGGTGRAQGRRDGRRNG